VLLTAFFNVKAYARGHGVGREGKIVDVAPVVYEAAASEVRMCRRASENW